MGQDKKDKDPSESIVLQLWGGAFIVYGIVLLMLGPMAIFLKDIFDVPTYVPCVALTLAYFFVFK